MTSKFRARWPGPKGASRRASPAFIFLCISDCGIPAGSSTRFNIVSAKHFGEAIHAQEIPARRPYNG